MRSGERFESGCAPKVWHFYPELLPVAAIWIAHIGFDRMLGYGLKYDTAFGDTHLGWIGRTTHDGRQVDSE